MGQLIEIYAKYGRYKSLKLEVNIKILDLTEVLLNK